VGEDGRLHAFRRSTPAQVRRWSRTGPERVIAARGEASVNYAPL
jgi:hypothetical protein